MSFGDANAGFQAGVVNGPVSTTHVYSLGKPETPPSPSAVLPFPRDHDFVERGTILDQVHQRCAVPGSWAALVGLGGVGKSQLTIEYAYRAHEQSARTWVFWVYASNAARFEQSYRDIADRVKIPERKDPTADIFQLVHNWLCDSKERWLLVLDNVDDARFLVDVSTVSRSEAVNSKGAPKPLRSYIPHSERGSVLVTTRNQDAALELVERRDIITVDPMDEVQARTLFEKKLEGKEREHEDSAGVDELAAALEYMPLAIVQAAAYIVQRGPRCSVRQYLEELKRSERKRTSLLNHNGGQLRRDWEASNSIIVTWQISFEHIQETRPLAADLLSLMSFFDRQGIPEELVRTRAPSADVRNEQKLDEDGLESDSDDDTSQSSEGDDEFEEDMATLRSFYFISVETGGTSFEMHALVQLATRKWLDANGRLEQWKQQFISNLSAAFPTGHYENWKSCRALFPHAKSAAGQKPQEAPSLEEWAMLMYRAAWYAEQIGDMANAEALAVQSMKVRKKVLGPDHEDTLWSIAMVADAYSLGGRMANLASTYRNQGRWDDAEKLFVQVMKTRKTKLGDDHPDTLASMNNLAFTWKYQGRDAEAITLMRECVQSCYRRLGANHPNFISSSATLAEWEGEQTGAFPLADQLNVHSAIVTGSFQSCTKRVLTRE
ncbi:putative kinesin [Corynespora cassiicola Philippines]|uniref:Putative kinesin n=1 Tax=Corynespora cassiicola Philippines TaxID=1448308 RepID=A0A2T2N0P2_CORCC|nr:putative kinesin [Corynespora cassiicola Philippines]